MTGKPRIFLDINVLVSGIVFRGNERRLLDAVIDGDFKLVLSPDVISEVRAVLERKFPKIAVLFPVFLRLVEHEEITKSTYKDYEKEYLILIEDKTDLHILAAAKVSGADYLVTGDKRVLSLKQVGDTEIVRTRELLERLKPR